MTHSTEELILADRVRTVAVNRLLAGMPDGLTDEQKTAWKTQSIRPYVLDVMAELERIADLISDFRQA